MALPNPRRSTRLMRRVSMRESRLRHTGISVVGDMPWGTHFCHFYDSIQDLLDTVVPYFKAGLDDKEFCVWVIAEPLTKEEAWNALRLAVPDLDRHLADKSIEMFVGEEWYLKNDTFDLQRVISAWNEKLEQALARGYAGMRVSGDTCWLRKKDWQDFCSYENHLNESISDQAMTVWCTYPLAKSGAAEILDVARTHQFCLTRRSGNWEVIETPEIKLAKREITKLNEELERRVDERTEQLLDANEHLRNEIAERKRVEEELRRSEAYLAEGQNISHTGSWAWNVTTGDLFWSLEHFRIFGLDPDKVKLTYEMVVNCVHPEDRSLLQKTFENAVRNGDDYELDFRIVRPDGIRHIHSLAHAVYDENGAVIEYVGTVIDTTERKRGEEALRQAHDELAHASRVLTMGELTSSIAHEV